MISLDPGKQTGIAAGFYGDNQPYTLLDVWQVSDGVTGFINWWNATAREVIRNYEWSFLQPTVMVSEKFILRANAFVADTEPLVIEGALQALWSLPIHWQPRTDKTLVDDRVLKEHGLWHTGKQVGWKDARDTNDAIIHSLAYLKKNKHIPTLEKYWGKE